MSEYVLIHGIVGDRWVYVALQYQDVGRLRPVFMCTLYVIYYIMNEFYSERRVLGKRAVSILGKGCTVEVLGRKAWPDKGRVQARVQEG